MSDAPMPVALLSFKPVTKGALRGFATVRIGKSLTVHDVQIMNSSGKAWVNMPGKPLYDTLTGLVLKDENGKVRYGTVLEWSDRDASNRFSIAVIAALRMTHPHVLGDAV